MSAALVAALDPVGCGGYVTDFPNEVVLGTTR